MKPGYQGSDSLRSHAESCMGRAEMNSGLDKPQAYKKGGHVKVKCMAMGGAGKIRHKQTGRGKKG